GVRGRRCHHGRTRSTVGRACRWGSARISSLSSLFRPVTRKRTSDPPRSLLDPPGERDEWAAWLAERRRELRAMKLAPVADVKAHLSGYLDAAAEGPVIITKNGRP